MLCPCIIASFSIDSLDRSSDCSMACSTASVAPCVAWDMSVAAVEGAEAEVEAEAEGGVEWLECAELRGEGEVYFEPERGPEPGPGPEAEAEAELGEAADLALRVGVSSVPVPAPASAPASVSASAYSQSAPISSARRDAIRQRAAAHAASTRKALLLARSAASL